MEGQGTLGQHEYPRSCMPFILKDGMLIGTLLWHSLIAVLFLLALWRLPLSPASFHSFFFPLFYGVLHICFIHFRAYSTGSSRRFCTSPRSTWVALLSFFWSLDSMSRHATAQARMVWLCLSVRRSPFAFFIPDVPMSRCPSFWFALLYVIPSLFVCFTPSVPHPDGASSNKH